MRIIVHLLVLMLVMLQVSAGWQPTYYCDSFGKKSIRDNDFYVVTRNSGSSWYNSYTTCDFRTYSSSSMYNGDQYLVEIVEHDVHSATLDLSSAGSTFFLSSKLYASRRSFVTKYADARIIFKSGYDTSRRRGVKLRVRLIRKNYCPPGWVKSSFGYCYGTGQYSGKLTFADAITSCHRMRANLLMPSSPSDLDRLRLSLPSTITKDAWVGVTDLTYLGRFKYRSLSGSSFSSSSVTCGSRGHTYCTSSDRCAAFSSYRGFSLEMDACNQVRNYTCYAPDGGTSRFYYLPTGSTGWSRLTSFWTWLWVPLIGLLFFLGFTLSALIRCMQRRQRPVGIVCARRAAVPPPGSYPTQQQGHTPTPFIISPGVMQHQQQQQQQQHMQAPPYPAHESHAPPPYAQAVLAANNNNNNNDINNGGGNVNDAFKQ